jgi:hypothetical protein
MLFLAMAVIVLSSCSASENLNAKHEPSLIGPEGGVDAGYIPPSGRDVKFTIRNPTNRPVVITHVEKSCGSKNLQYIKH